MTLPRYNRFVYSDASELEDVNRTPIYGYQNLPIMSLEDSVKKLIPSIPGLMDYIYQAKRDCNQHSTILTLDESAAIYLYTMQGLFFDRLNSALRVENRNAVKPWFAYLRLFLNALEKLPSVDTVIWRGVGGNIGPIVVADRLEVWWSVNSCSKALRVVKLFIADGGTVFAIDAIHGKDISDYSMFQEEEEIVLMPGTRLRVKGEPLNFKDSLFIAQLLEEPVSDQDRQLSVKSISFSDIAPSTDGNPIPVDGYFGINILDCCHSYNRLQEIDIDVNNPVRRRKCVMKNSIRIMTCIILLSLFTMLIYFLTKKVQQLPLITSATPTTSSSSIISVSSLLPKTTTPLPIPLNAKWSQNGITVAGGNGGGNDLTQLHLPFSLYIDDDDQTLYIADTSNHRIVEWKFENTAGIVVAGGFGQGNMSHQLNRPLDVIVDKETDSLIICDSGNKRVMRWLHKGDISGEAIIENIACSSVMMDDDRFLYISDTEKNEVKRWKMGEVNGTVVAGGNGQGNHLNQTYSPGAIYIDQNRSVFVSEDINQRVMKWMEGAKEGITVAGNNGEGSTLTQLFHPNGIFVDQSGTVYVADSSNDRIVRWMQSAKQGSKVVGGNGGGNSVNQLNLPSDLSLDRQGNLYVVDMLNHRVQKFSIQL